MITLKVYPFFIVKKPVLKSEIVKTTRILLFFQLNIAREKRMEE